MLKLSVLRRLVNRSGSRRAQSLVEFALVLPLILVLVLGAIDFGRAFFSWVELTNASRVGANYAATHPDAWALNNTTQKTEYATLVHDSGIGDVCTISASDPTFPDGSRDLGNRARVDLTCNFSLVAPFLQVFFGDPIHLKADSTFPIRRGCTNCAAAPAGPPPPPANNCRLIPNMIGQSVAGARLQWIAAGFTGPFEPASADGWRTVSTKTIDQGGQVGCDGGTYAFFASSVTVSLAAIIEPVPPETCRTVPNVLGMPVAEGRSTWQTAGFDPARFTPLTGSDTRIISGANYTPADASPGQCREPDLAISVTSVPPPAPPPPPPCQVPSFVNTLRSDAQTTWNAAHFTTPVEFQGGNWTVVKGQTLVGGSYASCSSTIKLLK
jgi:hypothetical protein